MDPDQTARMLVANALCWFCHGTAYIEKNPLLLSINSKMDKLVYHDSAMCFIAEICSLSKGVLSIYFLLYMKHLGNYIGQHENIRKIESK
jgi:hypothetical protein